MSLRAFAAGALLLAGCGVNEQVLRDEQARSRKYRDAYETQVQENKGLKEKLAAKDAQKCGAGPASAAATPQ